MSIPKIALGIVLMAAPVFGMAYAGGGIVGIGILLVSGVICGMAATGFVLVVTEISKR
jgi:hypothetical protein